MFPLPSSHKIVATVKDALFLTIDHDIPNDPIWTCKFTYVSFLLALAYLLICIFCVYLLRQLLQQHRRRPQKAFLAILCLQSLARAAFFGLWPIRIFPTDCQPSLRHATHPFFDTLGTIPACLLIAAFSLYVLTIARVNKLFALHYNHHSPTCIVGFYRSLVSIICVLNVIAIFSTISELVMNESKLATLLSAISVWSVSIGLIVISVAFVYVVRSLFVMIQATIDNNQQEQYEQYQSTQYLNPPDNKPGMFNSSMSNGSNLMLPNVTSFNYHYDGENQSPSQYNNGPVDLKANLLGNPHHNEFSYGYQGRLALNPIKNPMKNLLWVAWVSCVALIFKAILFICLIYMMEEPSTRHPKMEHSLIYGLWYFISEIVPSIAMLITFKVVSAPTLQWRVTYNKGAGDDLGATNIPRNALKDHSYANSRAENSQIVSDSDDMLPNGSINSDIERNGYHSSQQHQHTNVNLSIAENIKQSLGSNTQHDAGYHATINSLYQLRATQRQNDLNESITRNHTPFGTPQMTQPTMIPQDPNLPTPTKRTKNNTRSNNTYEFEDPDDFQFGSAPQGSTPSFRDTTQQYLMNNSVHRNQSQPSSYVSNAGRYGGPSTYQNGYNSQASPDSANNTDVPLSVLNNNANNESQLHASPSTRNVAPNSYRRQATSTHHSHVSSAQAPHPQPFLTQHTFQPHRAGNVSLPGTPNLNQSAVMGMSIASLQDSNLLFTSPSLSLHSSQQSETPNVQQYDPQPTTVLKSPGRARKTRSPPGQQ